MAVVADWTAGDWLYYVLSMFVPLVLCVAVGSFVLWRRTKRAAALTQLVASALIFLPWLLGQIRYFMTPSTESAFARLFWSQGFNEAMSLLLHLSLVVFGLGYIWYALTERRI
jgi:hypothetical protein